MTLLRKHLTIWAGILLLVAACSNSGLGAPECDPPSPHSPWFGDRFDTSGRALAEIEATSAEIEAWGLLWETPPLPVEFEIKMVWRVTGSGDFEIRAVNEGTEADLLFGPTLHEESNFNRPGDEWGTAFVFPSPGCWDVQIVRGDATAHVWVEVEG